MKKAEIIEKLQEKVPGLEINPKATVKELKALLDQSLEVESPTKEDEEQKAFYSLVNSLGAIKKEGLTEKEAEEISKKTGYKVKSES